MCTALGGKSVRRSRAEQRCCSDVAFHGNANESVVLESHFDWAHGWPSQLAAAIACSRRRSRRQSATTEKGGWYPLAAAVAGICSEVDRHGRPTLLRCSAGHWRWRSSSAQRIVVRLLGPSQLSDAVCVLVTRPFLRTRRQSSVTTSRCARQ